MNSSFDEYTEIYHCCRWCKHFNITLGTCYKLEDEIIIDDEEDCFPIACNMIICNPNTFYCKYFES